MFILKTATVLGVLVACVCAPAAASDYVQGDRYLELGLSTPIDEGNFKKADVQFTEMPGSGTLTFKDPRFYSLEFGARMLDGYLRIGVQGISASAKANQGSLSLQVPASDGSMSTDAFNGSLQGSARIATLQVMSHLDLPFFGDRLVVTVGGGAGVALTEYSGMSLLDRTSGSNLQLYKAGGESVSYEVTAGVRWNLTSHLSFAANYTYVNTGTPSLDTMQLKTHSEFRAPWASLMYTF